MLQRNPDIRELSGPEKFLISEFGLCLCNTGTNWGPDTFSLISRSLISGLHCIMFASGPEDRTSIQGRVIPKTPKIVLDPALLNAQHY